MRTYSFLFFLVLLSPQIYSQGISNVSDLDFLVNKITTVYAGYSSKVKNNSFLDLVANVRKSNSSDTFAQFSRLTTYFKDYHLLLFTRFSFNNVDSDLNKKNLITVIDSEKRKKKSVLEGYWINELNNNIIYLKKNRNLHYEAYLIESKKKAPLGLCVLKLTGKNKAKIKTDFIDFDLRVRIFTESFFKSNSTLIVGSFGKWKKLKTYHEGMLKAKELVKLIPSIDVSDTNNIILKMPDFATGSIKIYDSLINANEFLISGTKNLIIDIRNNAGGVINCFYPLFPFLSSSKPIVSLQSLTLCSQDVIDDAREDFDKFSKNNDSLKIIKQTKYLNTLLANKNNFLINDIDTFKFNQKINNIKNIAIIMNYGCKSAAELMIIYFKNASKVKFFGESTAGAVDYLNIFDYKLPNSKYNLWIGTRKRITTLKQPSYDESGIKPDVYIHDDDTNWIDYVKRYYEKY